MSVQQRSVRVDWVRVPDSVNMAQLERRLDILDEEELAVYNRYRVDFKKVEFLTGRLLMKGPLAKRYGLRERDLHFAKNQYGKPLLSPELAKQGPPLYFNLTHSEKVIACVFTEHGDTGLDVEYAQRDHLEVMKTVFVPREIEYVMSQQESERLQAFYLIWTRKEAYIKAIGTGLSLAPDTFTVPLHPEWECDDKWEFYTCRPLDDYIFSLCAPLQDGVELVYQVQELDFQQLLAGQGDKKK